MVNDLSEHLSTILAIAPLSRDLQTLQVFLILINNAMLVGVTILN
jgi:hypothetical protein